MQVVKRRIFLSPALALLVSFCCVAHLHVLFFIQQIIKERLP